MNTIHAVAMFLQTLILLASVYFIYEFLKWLKPVVESYVAVQKVPGPPSKNWLFGNIHVLQNSPENIFTTLRSVAKDYYPLYRVHALHKGSVSIVSPEDCELILSNPAHNEKGYFYKLLHRWLKFGLLTSSGTKWQTRRKILTPAFHFNILQGFVDTFNEESENFVNALQKESSKSYINVTPLISQFTLKTIAQTAMGTTLDFESKKGNNYKKAIHDICRILLYRLLINPICVLEVGNVFFNPRYFKELRLTKLLHKFTREVIEVREKNFAEIELPKEEHDVYRGKKRLAMLDLLLSAKIHQGIIDDDGIQEEVDTFTFEGHDTTAVALGFILMLLSNHRNVQDLILQEMQDVLGDVNKKPNYADYQNMKYLERCIKEALRLYPSVYFMARSLGEDLTTHSGYLLKKSTIVIIHIYDVHHNPEIYPDPEKFDPDRFLPENIAQRHAYSYLPFSAGPRNCIGQKFAMLELKAAVCAVLSNFILEPIDTPETITLVADIVLRTKESIKIRFVPRS